MVKLSGECKTRMTTWCALALLVVGLFVLAGYVLFESPGHGRAMHDGSPAAADR